MDESLWPVLRSEELACSVPMATDIRRVAAGRSDVFVARLSSGEVVAFATRCPHQATSLEGATFWDDKLRCPRHLYLYDPHTGENVLPAHTEPPETLWKLKPGYLPTHRVEERDGWIWVAEAPQPAPPGYDPAREERPAGARARSTGRVEPPPPPGAAPVVEHPAETMTVSVGEEFEVVLPTSPSPGHLWKGEMTGGLLIVTGQQFQPGEHPCHRVRLSARAAGQCTMRWSYGRPWEDLAREVRSFEVRIGPAPS
ncbi:MAG: Rieske 2Fe-2S domain-containing protein [Actinomycetota bacterium]|nr:Rieske 2Fe-2S domain-containing protein [Actinomycetota bacterium]